MNFMMNGVMRWWFFLLFLSPFFQITLATQASASQKVIPYLIEKADSLSQTDGKRALIVTQHLIDEIGNSTDSVYSRVLLIRGDAYFGLGQFKKAIPCMERALKVAQDLKHVSLQLRANSSLGVVYSVMGDLENALVYYEAAVALLKEEHTPDEEANALISMSIFYHRVGRLSDSEKFARKAYEVIPYCKDVNMRVYVLNNYGRILLQNGKKMRGSDMMHQAVRLAEEETSPAVVLKTYVSMLSMFYEADEPDSVKHYMMKGRYLLSKVPSNSLESASFLQQSAIILQKYGSYALSNHMLHKVLEIAQVTASVPVPRIYQMMAHNYKKLHDYDHMEEMYRRNIEYVESLRTSTIDEQMSDFNVKYGTAQQELRIARMETEKAHFRFWLTIWISLMSVLAIVSCILIVFRVRQRRRAEELQRVRERLEGIEQERSRLAKDLHDGVCNDLLGVGYMLQIEDCDRNVVYKYIRKIRDEVRSLSHNLLPPQFHSLHIDQLFRNQAEKYGDFVVYHSSNDESWTIVSEDVAYQLYRIVQELLSNVHEHTNAGYIVMDMVLEQKVLKLTMKYEGDIKDKPAHSAQGIGLETTRRRLMLIGATLVQADTEKHNAMIITLKI